MFVKPFSLKQGYVLALALIMILAVLKYAAIEMLIFEQNSAAVVINVSGRQRMLSQRAVFFATSLVSSASESARQSARQSLENTVNEFVQNHKDLIHGNEARALPALKNKAIFYVYYNQDLALNDLVEDYVESIRVILANDGQGSEAQTALGYVAHIGPTILLEKLNEVVQLHEQGAIEDVHFISNIQKIFLVITLIVLWLEAQYLFRPMVRRIQNNITILKDREKVIKGQVMELQRLSYIASHDLQEPLRKIGGFTERLQKRLDGQLDEKSQTYMDFIMAGTLHMQSLIKDFYIYGQILASEELMERVDVHDLIKHAVKNLTKEVQEKQAVVDFRIMPVITCYKTMMAWVFEELISNAIKYSRGEQPVITISCEETKQEYVFCVADDGIGIDHKYFERIFEMFQRLHRKDDIPGTGFGLFMVQKIVERHGGRVWVESDEGKGSRFYFTVPMKPTDH